MLLRASRFVHQVPVGANRILLIHAVSHVRLPVTLEVGKVMDFFNQPRALPESYPELARLVPYDKQTLETFVQSLIERNLLTTKTAQEEQDELSAQLGATHGRDPGAMLDKYRRELKSGAKSYWTAEAAQNVRDLGAAKKRVDVALFGDCDVHMESDFLRQEAAKRGVDLRVAATAPDDYAFAAERKHDAVIVGALHARHFIVTEPAAGQEAFAVYIHQARTILQRLREKTAAPILIDNLPEPTVQPLGMAEDGVDGHRARFRRANLALAELAQSFPDVYVTDVAAAVAASGATPLIDDGQVGFTHMGSPGWMLQRPESEKAATHNLFPDTAPLAQLVDGNPYVREAVIAQTHIDALTTVLGIDRKKCVIVDLDGTLWPGVLAETGSPFAWEPAISGVFSYVGLYFGIHEALLCLKKRGIVLACVSKNDEATVRELWKYPDAYPKSRLLTMDDFVTHRINWNDKVENISSIADELGFALETFLFVDDHPIERDRVRQRLPEIEVWGEDLFGLRRKILNDPRLQVPKITDESAARTGMVKAQLSRQRFKSETVDEKSYLESLQIKQRIERQSNDVHFDRIEELFRRTTQFNATGRLFTAQELRNLLNDPQAHIYAMHVSDRFGDHGLVGAAVIENGEITGLVMSCRVLGLGVERKFLRHVLDDLKGKTSALTGRIVETSRNLPVRNIYRDNGFTLDEKGAWRIQINV